MRSELHSTNTANSTTRSLNSSNVNRFHAESTTNLVATVTPAECNSSSVSNCTNNISVTALTTASASASALELPNSSAADLAVAAAVYDFASFHQIHHQSHHQTANNYFDDNFANGISHWDNIAAHHSALTSSLSSSLTSSLAQHYHHHHQHPHQISSFGAFSLSVPPPPPPATSSSSTMTVQRVNQSLKAQQQSSSTNGGANHLSDYHNSSNGMTTNYSINGNSSTVSKVSKPRRRVATMAQRRAANIRERRRMFNLNSAFDKLRKKVPTFAYEKRLSRIETLRLAIMYIAFMTEVLKGSKDPCFEPRIPLHSSGTYHNHNHDRDRDHIWNANHYTFNSFTDVFQPCRY